MNKTTEALKLAEEALESCNSGKWSMSFDEIDVERALAAIREALAEPVKQEPVAWQFPRQPNNEGGWTIDAKFLNILVKDMADDEFAVGMEETEAVLLALERSYAEPVQTVKQEPVAWHLDAETAKFLADMITADDEPTEITLRLGFIRDDDGKVQYGLLVEDSEYPEEGACLLVECEPLNAAPVSAKREWVELTDYEIVRLYAESPMCDSEMIAFARAAIAAFKEKNK